MHASVARPVVSAALRPQPAEVRHAVEGPVGSPAALFRLQRSAGNRAVTAVVQRDRADHLISAHTRLLMLDEARLGRTLAGLVDSEPGTVVDVFRALGATDRDDVAVALATAATDDQLRRWATTAGGQRVLTHLLGELSVGVQTQDEVTQRDRILGFVRNDRPGAPDTRAHDAAVGARRGPAAELIRRHSGVANPRYLRVPDLVQELRRGLPGNADLTEAVLDQLASRNLDDDVANAIIRGAEEDELARIAAVPRGRELLTRMVRTLGGGRVGPSDQAAMQRAMTAVTAADRQRRGGAALEVEVITFLYGGSRESPGGGLDRAGSAIGSRGHTLIVVGGDVYSFELGWSCGRSKAEYLADNDWRDGIGQVLRITDAADAERVQKRLVGLCGSGVYGLSSRICTGAAAQALEEAIPRLGNSWWPGTFATALDARGVVATRRFYPQTARPR